MLPVEDQLAEYFGWLDGAATEGADPPAPDRGRKAWPLLLAAAAIVALLVGGLVVLARSDEPAPVISPPPTIEPDTTLPPSVTSVAPGAVTPLWDTLADAGVDMAALSPGIIEAIEDVAEGAARLCGIEDPDSPLNGTGVEVNSPARRCFLDSYVVGAPAVLVLQGPTYLTPPGIEVWRTGVDRALVVERTVDGEPEFEDLPWTATPCGRLSTDVAGSASPAEAITCGATAFPLPAGDREVPSWFTDRDVLPLCGYGIPPTDGRDARCFTENIDADTRAEYVAVADDGRSAIWWRSLGDGVLERIDWRIDAAGNSETTRTRCTDDRATLRTCEPPD
jgi:hypothetical protein